MYYSQEDWLGVQCHLNAITRKFPRNTITPTEAWLEYNQNIFVPMKLDITTKEAYLYDIQ